jgi:hypothetical protein
MPRSNKNTRFGIILFGKSEWKKKKSTEADHETVYKEFVYSKF